VPPLFVLALNAMIKYDPSEEKIGCSKVGVGGSVAAVMTLKRCSSAA
jgi:hypothetical protein